MLDKELQQLWFKIKKVEGYPVTGIMISQLYYPHPTTARTARLSRTVWPNFSSLSFVIRVNLLHP